MFEGHIYFQRYSLSGLYIPISMQEDYALSHFDDNHLISLISSSVGGQLDENQLFGLIITLTGEKL